MAETPSEQRSDEIEQLRAENARLWRTLSLLRRRGADATRGDVRAGAGIDPRDDVAARLNAIVNTAVDGIITFDRAGIVESVNPAVVEIFGYTPAEVIGRNVEMLVTEPHRYGRGSDAKGRGGRGRQDELRTVERQIIGIGPEAVGHRKDGSTFPVELAVSATRLGDRLLFTGIVRDVTERKQVEDHLSFLAEAGTILASSLDYEATLQTVADLTVPRLADWCAVDLVNSFTGIERVAVAHVDSEKVRWAHELQKRYPVDPRAERGAPKVIRTGEPEFYPEVTDEMLVQVARNERHLELLRRAGFRSLIVVPLSARGQTLGALTLVWSDSNRHYTRRDLGFAEQLARRAAIAVDNAHLYHQMQQAERRLKQHNETLEARVAERTGELTAANARLRAEIAERERTRQALARANRHLQQRNRELRDFAYVASHDLKEPLRKIQTFADLVRTEHAGQLDETGTLYMERMQNAARRMASLIDDLLAFSRVTTKGESFREIDLAQIVREVLHDLEVRVQEANGSVELGELPCLHADPLQMRQLLQNLIGNALKFHREGVPPRVEVRGEILAGDVSTAGVPRLRITVADNGIGFESKYADRIFSPFQRLHGRSAYEGTGMGLAICRRIVERHGGTIAASGEPERGAVFTVTLPIQQARGDAHEEPA